MMTLLTTTVLAGDGQTITPVEIIPTYDWYSGEGPYLIDSVEDLAGVAKLTQGDVIIDESTTLIKTNFKDKTVQLKANITFGENQYLYYHDGTNAIFDYRIKNFAGTFDGNDKKIIDMKLTGSGNYICLFNSIVSGSTIKNLTLDTVTVNGALNWTGGMVGLVNNGATITECIVNNMTVKGDSIQNYGAIASYVYGGGTITDCSVNNLKITATNKFKSVGGIAGQILKDAIISGDKVNGVDLTSNNEFSQYIGGVAGVVSTNITNCTAENVNITIYKAEGVGGLLGITFGDMKTDTNIIEITDCHSENITVFSSCITNKTDDRETFHQVGGLVGGLYTFKTTIKDCSSSTINLSTNGGIDGAAGLIGVLGKYDKIGIIENCDVENVHLSGDNIWYAGGLMGLQNGNELTVKETDISDITLFTKGQTNKTGGFLGANEGNITLDTCTATNITMMLGDNAEDQIKVTGGFIGQIYGGTNNSIKNCTLTGLDATIAGEYETAFAGFVTMSNATTTFENCSVSGKIDATNVDVECETGGFLGELGYAGKSSTTLTGCSADVDIISNGPAGGFIASSWGYSTGSVAGTITATDCVASGDVTSLFAEAGGFVGVGNRGTFTNCAANGSVSGVTAGGFWGEITPNNSNMVEKNLSINGCESNNQVLGTEIVSGFVGTIATADEANANATNVNIENSTGALLVVAASSETEINEFAKDITPADSTALYTTLNNTVSEEIIQVITEGKTLTLKNGEIVIPADTVIEFSDGEQISLPNESTITISKNNARIEINNEANEAKMVIDNLENITEEEKINLKASIDEITQETTVNIFNSISEESLDAIGKNAINNMENVIKSVYVFTITFNANGGTVNTTSGETDTNSKLLELPIPTRDGYIFVGWFDSLEAGNQITTETVFEADTEIFAHWQVRTTGGNHVISYIVKFETDGGSKISSKTVKKNNRVNMPVDPIKEGYRFVGWFTDKELTEAYDFSSKVKKSFTLYAKWIEEKELVVEPIEWTNPFADVSKNDWFYDAVEYVHKNELMNGMSEELFEPNRTTTRAMIVTILHRLENELRANSNRFNDVLQNEWYTDSISWANEIGLVEGYGDGRFGPNDEITREQLVTILYRYAQYKKQDVSVGENTNILSYNDTTEVSEYAIEAFQWACGENLVNGVNDGVLAPKNAATRAQIATIMMRFIENIQSK